MNNTSVQIAVIAFILLPVLAIVLWPLWRKGRGQGREAPGADDRSLELIEEKTALYRALKEITFDYEAGHLSEDDYRALRSRYEARAAELLPVLDALAPATAVTEPAGEPVPTEPAPARRGFTRHPLALAGGIAAILALGVVIGLGVGRFTEPERAMPPGSGLGVPLPREAGTAPGPLSPGSSPRTSAATPRALTPEMLAGMLQAARQSLMEGRYHEAIAAYQAVLKREPQNVDAMTHMALLVAMGGHADQALAAFDKALKIDPRYAPAYFYQGQVLYEVKRDYPGAVKAWEGFLALVPSGEERDQVAVLVKEARAKQDAR